MMVICPECWFHLNMVISHLRGHQSSPWSSLSVVILLGSIRLCLSFVFSKYFLMTVYILLYLLENATMKANHFISFVYYCNTMILSCVHFWIQWNYFRTNMLRNGLVQLYQFTMLCVVLPSVALYCLKFIFLCFVFLDSFEVCLLPRVMPVLLRRCGMFTFWKKIRS